MQTFPADFADLLNAKGKRLLRGKSPTVAESFQRSIPHYISLPGIFDPPVAQACIGVLDRQHYPELKNMTREIPRKAIWGMRKNYSDQMPKNMRMRTSYLTSRTEIKLGKRSGLLTMMQSQSFRRLAEALTGYRLLDDWDCQLICYTHGDYAGPHNDHHPEYKSIRNGFVDLHVMLANDAVSHQWLVYEDRGLMTKIQSINLNGAVSAYLLPFWHYTTPLTAKPGREARARRWLLLGSFEIDPPLARRPY